CLIIDLYYSLVKISIRDVGGAQDDGCGESTLGPDSGHLSFKKYPGVYPNNSWCQWKILVSSSLRIVLKFEDLSIDGWDCKTDNLKIHGTKHVYWQYCGLQKANPTLYLGVNQSLYIDSSEVTVSFRSSIHSSGRGFQLSYSTVDHRGNGCFIVVSSCRKYCPAGCGAAQGDVVGDVSQGYRHVSAALLFCSGLACCSFDSLSDSFLTFVTNDCNRQTILQPLSTSLLWEKNSLEGTPVDRSPKDTNTVTPTGMWSADCKQWLQLDLGEKKRITGILTKGSTTSDYFVKSYKILYKEKSRWRNYTHYNSSEDTIFEGNVDNLNQTRYTFHPAITARYLCVPLQWHRGTGLTVELLGCDVRTTPGVLLVIFEGREQSSLFLSLSHRKKTKENTYDSADPPHAGCWKQVKHPSARQQSTEFTFSYSSEKDHLPKIDLVTSDMADYQQPLMLGVGTVSRKGSTFRPMDTDTKDEVNETATHYDYLHTANQYALPLTNQEPEYATPIIERHAFRKDGFLPDPSYSVPGVVLSKSPSFKTKDSSNYRKVVGGISGGYQTPQVKLDRANHSEGVYDSPKVRKPLGVQNGVCSEYQRPQKKTTAQESYSTPRDCVRLDTTAPCRPDPEGSSLSGP
uniref:Discoidin, CUB and LCCL domain containing 1 n=1 Tax=Astyanax mexicanus TaxID=7994 RepID=A0A8B9KMY4_ASTMX